MKCWWISLPLIWKPNFFQGHICHYSAQSSLHPQSHLVTPWLLHAISSNAVFEGAHQCSAFLSWCFFCVVVPSHCSYSPELTFILQVQYVWISKKNLQSLSRVGVTRCHSHKVSGTHPPALNDVICCLSLTLLGSKFHSRKACLP